jgi:cation-transporting ATPase I
MLLVNVLTDMFPALAVAVGDNRSDTEDVDGADPASAVSTLGRELPRAVAVCGTATAVGASAAWAVGRVTGLRRGPAPWGWPPSSVPSSARRWPWVGAAPSSC